MEGNMDVSCKKEESIHQVLKPLLMFEKFLGLAPFNLIKQNSNLKIKISYVQLTYSLSAVLITCILYFYNFPWNSFQGLYKIIIIIEYLTSKTVCIICMIIELSTVNRRGAIFQHIYTIDNRLKELKIKIHFLRQKKRLLIQLSFLFGYWLMFVTYFGYMCRQGVNSKCRSFVHMVNSFFLYLLRITILFEIYVITENIKFRFHEINNRLENLNKDQIEAVSGLNIENVLPSAQKRKSGYEIAHELRKQHGHLCDVMSDLNSKMSLQIVMSVAIAFCTVVGNLFYLYRIIHKHGADAPLDLYRTAGIAFITFAEVLILMYVFGSTSEKARLAGTIIYQILGEMDDPKIEKELQIFAQQIIQRNPRFSGCGFFPLDNSLVFTMVGAITTYMVILIQFHDCMD